MASLEKETYQDAESQPMLDEEEKQDSRISSGGYRYRRPKKFNGIWTALFVTANCVMFLVTIADIAFRISSSGKIYTTGYASNLNPLLKQTSYFCKF